jgi:hypothetical protein
MHAQHNPPRTGKVKARIKFDNKWSFRLVVLERKALLDAIIAIIVTSGKTISNYRTAFFARSFREY